MRASTVAAAVVFTFLAATSASAANYTVDERTGARLSKAQELMAEEQYAAARAELKAFNTEKMNPYERALVFQFLAYIAHGMNDPRQAASYFEKSLAEEALPESAQIPLRFNLAQLYMSLEQWPKAIANLERWFREAPEPNPVAYHTLAVAYYQSGQRSKAIAPASKAVSLGRPPKESWLQLLLALRLEADDHKRALPVLKQLVSRYPKKTYWMQLAALYAELHQDLNSLAAQQLAYQQGLLTTDKELRRLGRLYLYNDLPYRAAVLLEEAMAANQIAADAEALELLGNSWLAARETDRALEPLERAAAKSGDGDLWVRAAHVRMDRHEWERASAALRKGLEAGVDHPGEVHLLLGITALEREQLDSAAASFARASKYDASRKAADRWLQHVERKRTEQAELASG